MERIKEYELIRSFMPIWHYWFSRPFRHFWEEGITREMTFCLLTLYHENKELNMSNLAKKAHVSKQQMTKIVDKLVKYSFIERLSNDIDRRIVMIKITKKGRNYLENHNQKEYEYYGEVLGLMNEDDRKIFLESIEKIHDIMSKLPHSMREEREENE